MTASSAITPQRTLDQALDDASWAGWLSREARRSIEQEMTERVVAAGELLRPGADGVLYVVVDGLAELVSTRRGRMQVRATLTVGEIFGTPSDPADTALQSLAIRAVSTVTLWVLDASAFRDLRARSPTLAEELDQLAEHMSLVLLLKLASPFQRLSGARVHELMQRLERRPLRTGEVLIQQGAVGEEAFVVLRGSLRIDVLGADGAQRQVDTTEPGMLIGESALLARTTRNATVTATEPAEVLVLQRADLLYTMKEAPRLNRDVRALLVARARPRRAGGILVSHRLDGEGQTLTTLKDPSRNAYFRLSAAGWRLWQSLDGQTSFADLAAAYSREDVIPRPDRASRLVFELMEAGFLDNLSLRRDLPSLHPISARWWPLEALARVATWRWVWRGADAVFDWLYRHGGAWLCTRPVQWLMGVVGGIGLVVLASQAGQVAETLKALPLGAWLVLLPMLVVQSLVHEAGHGLMTKHAGCRVNGAGIGWYWFTMIVFVDTSDSWLASQRSRIRITLAGPWTDFFVGGACALMASFSTGLLAALLWQFAALSYLSVLANLNPLMRFDGYYLLIDWLERPNLRAEAVRWLRRPTRWRERWIEASYALGAGAYVALSLALLLTSYRLLAADLIAQLTSSGVAAGVSWALGLGLVALTTAGLWGEVSAAGRREGLGDR